MFQVVSEYFVYQLFYSSIAIACSAVVLIVFLRMFRTNARIQQIGWFVILFQGIILFSIPFEITNPFRKATNFSSEEITATESSGSEELRQIQNQIGHRISIQSNQANSVVHSSTKSSPFNLSLFLFSIWIAGIFMLSIRFFLLHRNMARVVSAEWRLNRKEFPKWNAEFQEVKKELKIQGNLRFLPADGLGPALFSIGTSPIVLVPKHSWGTFTKTQRRIALTHELVHWKSGDPYKKLLGLSLAIIQWFNPFAWIAFSKLNLAFELDCDRKTVQNTDVLPTVYAKQLLKMLEIQTSSSPTLLSMNLQIRQRVWHLLQKKDYVMKITHGIFGILMIGFIAISGTRIELVSSQEKTKPLPPKSHWNHLTNILPKEIRIDRNFGKMTQYPYQINGLVSPKNNLHKTKFTRAASKSLVRNNDHPYLTDDVIAILQWNIKPYTWGFEGGDGPTIIQYSNPEGLVVRHDQETQRQIKEMIDEIRTKRNHNFRFRCDVRAIHQEMKFQLPASGRISKTQYKKLVQNSKKLAIDDLTLPHFSRPIALPGQTVDFFDPQKKRTYRPPFGLQAIENSDHSISVGINGPKRSQYVGPLKVKNNSRLVFEITDWVAKNKSTNRILLTVQVNLQKNGGIEK